MLKFISGDIYLQTTKSSKDYVPKTQLIIKVFIILFLISSPTINRQPQRKRMTPKSRASMTWMVTQFNNDHESANPDTSWSVNLHSYARFDLNSILNCTKFNIRQPHVGFEGWPDSHYIGWKGWKYVRNQAMQIANQWKETRPATWSTRLITNTWPIHTMTHLGQSRNWGLWPPPWIPHHNL